jgi:hypothetical protein
MPPVELLLDALLYLFLPAALTAAIPLAILERLGGPRLAPAGSALGLAAGTFLGLAAREGVQRWNAGEFWGPWWSSAWILTSADTTWNRLPWATFGILAIGWATSWPRLPRAAAWIVRAIGVGGAAAWLAPSAVRDEYGWLVPAFAAVVLGAWALLEYVARHPPDGTALACSALTAFVTGGVLLYAASGRSSEAAIIMGSALAGLALIAWWRRIDAGAAVGGPALFLPSLLLAAQLEKSSDLEITWHTFALPALAPLMLAWSLPLRDWKPMDLRLLRLGLVLAPLITAIIFARIQAGPLEFE